MRRDVDYCKVDQGLTVTTQDGNRNNKEKNIIVDYIDLIILILLMWGLYSLKLLEYGFFKIWIVLLIGQHECEGWLWCLLLYKW